MFFWWTSTKIVQAVWIRQKTWPPGGRAYFPYICIYIENFKKSSCQKPMDRFQYNLEGMCLWSPSSKVVQAIMICQKIWLQGGWGLFSLYIYIENLKKNLLVRNHWTNFSITWQKCFLGDPLPKLFRPSWFVKNMAARGWAYFPCISI